MEKDKLNISFTEVIKTINKMKKVVGYIRVSTTLQKEKGNSISNQIDLIKKYCNQNELQLDRNDPFFEFYPLQINIDYRVK